MLFLLAVCLYSWLFQFKSPPSPTKTKWLHGGWRAELSSYIYYESKAACRFLQNFSWTSSSVILKPKYLQTVFKLDRIVGIEVSNSSGMSGIAWLFSSNICMLSLKSPFSTRKVTVGTLPLESKVPYGYPMSLSFCSYDEEFLLRFSTASFERYMNNRSCTSLGTTRFTSRCVTLRSAINEGNCYLLLQPEESWQFIQQAFLFCFNVTAISSNWRWWDATPFHQNPLCYDLKLNN